MNKRTLLGLVAAIATQALFGYLFSYVFESLFTSVTPQTVTVCFIGSLVGAFIAGRSFLLPSLVIWVICWLGVLYVLSTIASSSILCALYYNWQAVLFSLCAVIIGFVAGNYFSPRQSAAIV